MISCLASLLFCISAAPATEEPWYDLYRAGFPISNMTEGWQSPLTSSISTPDGLRIADPSTAKGSGRFFQLDWHVEPRRGATVEARLQALACSEPWGVALLVADGVHEEGVTFFPHQIMLAASRLTASFDTAGQFHTYRVRIQESDIQVWADDQLLLDGRGHFTHPAHGGRNQLGFGCGSSTATGEAIWQWIRFQGGKADGPQVTVPTVAGLDIQVGATQIIVPGAIYRSLFQLADGRLAVADRRSDDARRTWHPGPALNTGAYQFPDGDLVQLGFHRRRTDRPGDFSIPLVRSTDNGLTTCYNSVEEVAPDELLVVYDRRQLDPRGNLRPELVGTTVRVRRR